jgi:hypothetical protein
VNFSAGHTNLEVLEEAPAEEDVQVCTVTELDVAEVVVVAEDACLREVKERKCRCLMSRRRGARRILERSKVFLSREDELVFSSDSLWCSLILVRLRR